MGKLMIAGDRSGSGKTTVTIALLAALKQQGHSVQAFKVGPDYIDPMFHRAITGRPAYNLDPVLTSERYVQECFQRYSCAAKYAIVEGVMGLFDGAGGSDWASTAHVARLLNCPILLVVDCARLSRSLAAIVHGYCTLDTRLQIAGVVLNRVGSDRHLAMLTAALNVINVPLLGVLRRESAIALPDRHLGLVPADELPQLPTQIRQLAQLGKSAFDWPQLTAALTASNTHAVLPIGGGIVEPAPDFQVYPVRVGIARDRAFNFYYEDNLALFRRHGAEIVPFSPLIDPHLPVNLDGLILGGGFPEVFAAALSQNLAMRTAIAAALAAGLPTYAECGGLMYLCQTIVDFDQRSWPMVGALPAVATMTGKLTLGYRCATAQQPSSVMTVGQQAWGHEFHRSVITPLPPKPIHTLQSYPLPHTAPAAVGAEGWGHEDLHASYVHLHWGGQPALAQKFLQRCDRFHKQQSS
ncbi:MAG: cobyrinate a,c-diamide synthase [Leptolyngbyaceae cyanobacterium]